LLAGLGIAGVPLGGLLTPLALALWLRFASRSPQIGGWLGQHAVLGLFAAIGSGLWVPPALVALGAPRAAACLASAGLAIWHGALPFALVALLSHSTRTRGPGLQIAGYAAAVFAVETFVSRSGLFIPWVLLGHSQASCSPLAALATLGGVPAISAALAALGSISNRSPSWTSGSQRATDPLAPHPRLAWGLALGLLAFAVLTRPGPGRLDRWTDEGPDELLRVLAVQPNFPTSGRWDPPSQSVHANRIGAYSQQALDAHEPRPDLLLWPENSVTWGPGASDPRRLVAAWAARLDVALIAGLAAPAASRSAGAYRNLLVWFGRDGTILDSVDKEIGVPGFETAPSERWWSAPIRALLGRAAVGAKATTRAGIRSLQADATITQALCFEALFPGLVARRRTPATALLLNPTDDRWATTPRAARQLARYASFRAIEQRLPLVRVAHAGPTVLYDARGRAVDSLAPDSFGALGFVVDRKPTLREARRHVLGAVLVGTLAGFLVVRCPAVRPARRRHTREPIADAARGRPRASGDRGGCEKRVKRRRRLLAEVAQSAPPLAQPGRDRKRRPAIRTRPSKRGSGAGPRNRPATTRFGAVGPRYRASPVASSSHARTLARELLINMQTKP
jgi:apolipoprotein N-acyltransferase